ncbi:MAG: hypothetical protein U0W40_12380 [Acidimicrobiia bacterium]
MARTSNLLPCPRCGSTKRYQILWGFYAEPLSEAKSKRYVLGGCCVDPFGASHQCKECELQYRAWRDEFPASERLRIDTPQDQ